MFVDEGVGVRVGGVDEEGGRMGGVARDAWPALPEEEEERGGGGGRVEEGERALFPPSSWTSAGMPLATFPFIPVSSFCDDDDGGGGGTAGRPGEGGDGGGLDGARGPSLHLDPSSTPPELLGSILSSALLLPQRLLQLFLLLWLLPSCCCYRIKPYKS